MKNSSYSISGNYSKNIIEGLDEISESAPINVPIFNFKLGDVGNGSEWPSIAHQDRANPNDFALSQNKDGTTVLNAPIDKSLHFRLGNEDKMVIKNNNIGIGITDPQTKLHVDGTVTAKDFVDSDGILTANQKLCIGETCVDEEQLQYMLNPKVTTPVTAPVAAPVATTGDFGNIHLGPVGHGAAWQGIANKNNVNKTNYALIQHNNGSTIINSKAGQNLHFRQGNKDKMIIDKNGNTTIDGTHLGQVGHGTAWQGIANKNNVNKNNYALIQHNNGSTIINSKAGQNLHFRQGNKDKMIIKTDGNVEIKGHITGKKGMNMSGGRSYFKDDENKGRVRVGAAWGIPGIYSQDNQDIVVGVAPGKTAHIGSNNKFMSVKGDGDVNIKGKLCIGNTCLTEDNIKKLSSQQESSTSYPVIMPCLYQEKPNVASTDLLFLPTLNISKNDIIRHTVMPYNFKIAYYVMIFDETAFKPSTVKINIQMFKASSKTVPISQSIIVLNKFQFSKNSIIVPLDPSVSNQTIDSNVPVCFKITFTDGSNNPLIFTSEYVIYPYCFPFHQ
jgi:hypothetical protein